jgi:hypothetical protein
MFDDSALRLLIYDEIVRTGETPVVVTLASLVGASLDDVRASLRRMHDAHMLVLQPTGEILMANPFSAVPTPFLAEVGGRRWFGNCIWDALEATTATTRMIQGFSALLLGVWFMAEQSSRIGPRTILARFQRERPRKRRPNEPRWITEEIILLEFANPCGIHVSFSATVQTTVAA